MYDVAQADPNFAVDFQVDYVDDEFGLLLAKMVDAVDSCDRTLFGMYIKGGERGEGREGKGERKEERE